MFKRFSGILQEEKNIEKNFIDKDEKKTIY